MKHLPICLATAGLATLGVSVWLFHATRPVQAATSELPPSPASQEATPTGPIKPYFERGEIAFGRAGSVAEIVQSVERVVGPSKAAAAERRGPGEARWLCVLVDDVGPYASLLGEGSLADFPGLEGFGFAPAPGPLGRKLSLYLGHVKLACAFQPERGDRIVVLTCPKERWPELKLTWPKLPEAEESF